MAKQQTHSHTVPKTPPAPELADQPTSVGKAMFHIRAVGVARRCRAGLAFDEAGRSVEMSSLTAAQRKAIGDDPHLSVEEV